jgi:hypothetical protein
MASKYHLKTRNQPEIKNPFKIKSVFLCNFKVKKTLMLAPLVKKEQFGLIRAKKKKENGRTKWHCEQSVHGAM